MKDSVKFPVLPELSAIDFTSSKDVRNLIQERWRHMYGQADDGCIDACMEAIEGLFGGRFPEYQPMDTAYHNITHTMQATLCLGELLHHRHFSNAEPVIGAGDFRRAVVAVLFHDIGYLKRTGDSKGTGAKYTHVHEKRSCELARAFLTERGWTEDDIVFVENLISATGPTADLTKIPFRTEIERLLGKVVCTADYVGQMSDPQYPNKLEVLFHEFEESYRYQGIPRAKWPFRSYEALLRSTPDFWGKFVQHRMMVDCGGVWDHLEHPVAGNNPYIESIQRNLQIIERQIASLGKLAPSAQSIAAS